MGQKFALLVGNSRFEDGKLAKLSAPKEDVERLRETLQNPKIGDFDNVIAIYDAELSDARQKTVELFKNRKPDDLLLFYFSGHGILDIYNDFYLALPRTSLNAPEALSLEASFVREQMKKSRSQRQIVILDCCHSGAFMEGAKAQTGAHAVTKSTFSADASGRVVIAASTDTEFAYERKDLVEGDPDQRKRSVFTYFLVEGLKTGLGQTDNQYTTIHDLYNYVRSNIPKEVPMTPNYWAASVTGEIEIAQNPNWKKPLPDNILSAITSTDEHARLWAVQELAKLLHDNKSLLRYSALHTLSEARKTERLVVVRDAIDEALLEQPTVEHPPPGSGEPLVQGPAGPNLEESLEEKPEAEHPPPEAEDSSFYVSLRPAFILGGAAAGSGLFLWLIDSRLALRGGILFAYWCVLLSVYCYGIWNWGGKNIKKTFVAFGCAIGGSALSIGLAIGMAGLLFSWADVEHPLTIGACLAVFGAVTLLAGSAFARSEIWSLRLWSIVLAAMSFIGAISGVFFQESTDHFPLICVPAATFLFASVGYGLGQKSLRLAMPNIV